jgi:two-component system response regulator NreC
MRVLLADDHPVLRAGLRTVLASEHDIEIVAEEIDGTKALAAIRALKPDVAVLDIQMPGLSGIEVAQRLGPGVTAIVMLSLHREEHDVQAALEAGVLGYVVKDDVTEELVHAIRAASRGEMHMSPRVSGSLVRALRRDGAAQASTLTPRERDVLRLLASGLRTKEIADRLALSPKTVEGHRAALMEKLNIRSVAGLVKYALKHHLADL